MAAFIIEVLAGVLLIMMILSGNLGFAIEEMISYFVQWTSDATRNLKHKA